MLYAYRKYLKTISTDNGSEFAAHLDITAGLRRQRSLDDVTVTSPMCQCSWQKGAVENNPNPSVNTSLKKVKFQ